MIERKCGTCDYYHRAPLSKDKGECRRLSPRSEFVPMPVGGMLGGQAQMQMQLLGFWPPTKETDWCGEWSTSEYGKEIEELKLGKNALFGNNR